MADFLEHATVGKPIQLQTAASATGNGVQAAAQSKIKNHSFFITGSAGVASGAVTLEAAPTPGYAGTWHPLASAVTVVASTTKLTTVSNTPLAVIRARISTVLVGGTVDVTYIGSD